MNKIIIFLIIILLLIVMFNVNIFKKVELETMKIVGSVLKYTIPQYVSYYGNEFEATKMDDNLYISNYYSACQKDKLKELGITHIVTLIPGFNSIYQDDFKYLNIDICDKSYCNIDEYFKECIKFIKGAIKNGGTVLVHCKAGVSRSASIICVYLMEKYKKTPDETIEIMKSKRSCINPNEGFRIQLLDYYNKKINYINNGNNK